MAAPKDQTRAYPYFLALRVILALLYILVFFTGDHQPKPKLGLDLQGGTSMTLQVSSLDGTAIDPKKLKGQMETARQIIANRVDISGVAEPEVLIEGNDTIVVNVAGCSDEEQLRKLVAPAVLRFRKVLATTPDKADDATATPTPSATPTASASPAVSGSAAVSATASGSAAASPAATTAAPAGSPASASPSANAPAGAAVAGRPECSGLSGAGTRSASPSSTASPGAALLPTLEAWAAASGSASASASASVAATSTATVGPSAAASASASAAAAAERQKKAVDDFAAILAVEIQRLQPGTDAAAARADADSFLAQVNQDPSKLDAQTVQGLAGVPADPFRKLPAEVLAQLPPELQYNLPQITCAMLDKRPPGSILESASKAVACSKAGAVRSKYFLDIAKVKGDDVSTADASNDIKQGWFVTLNFKGGKAQDTWTELTKEAFNNPTKDCAELEATPSGHCAVAIVLDNTVVSAPVIQGVIAAEAQITGSFSQDEAQTLARELRFGSLPIAFTVQSVESLSPTLGKQQMYMGLLAGGIGLALVIVYCVIYYRALGFVVIASLLVSGALVFASLVLLGRQLGFSLSLSGIAGFIVAIGITADSFVVFFERLKDEVKDGRSVRSAVPRAWVRARRTILSADAVSFLAAAVLYILAIGQVKGFAFTLGLSTIIDLVVVFMFTHPLVASMSRWNGFTSPRISGLGNLRSDKVTATQQVPARPGVVRKREA